MCGRYEFNAIFSSLPNLQVMKVASDSWVGCSTLYEYQVNQGDFQIGYSAFNSIRDHYLLLHDPFPDYSKNKEEEERCLTSETMELNKEKKVANGEIIEEDEEQGEEETQQFAFSLSLHYHYNQSTTEWVSPQSVLELPYLTQRGFLIVSPSMMNHCTSIPFNQLTHLERIEINDSAFLDITDWSISKLPYLRTIIIKNYVGFRESKPSYLKNMTEDSNGVQTNKQFIVEDCEKLETIVIGGGCFCDYDVFELKSNNANAFQWLYQLDLPSLESISIGALSTPISSPAYYQYQEYSFAFVQELNLEDLPSLKSVEIANKALWCCSNLDFMSRKII